MKENCIICLEPTHAQKPADLICQCKVVVHSKCWKTYLQQKGQAECPICHQVTLKNPLEVAMSPTVEAYVERVRQERMPKDCAKMCGCCFVLECLVVGILGCLMG